MFRQFPNSSYLSPTISPITSSDDDASPLHLSREVKEVPITNDNMQAMLDAEILAMATRLWDRRRELPSTAEITLDDLILNVQHFLTESAEVVSWVHRTEDGQTIIYYKSALPESAKFAAKIIAAQDRTIYQIDRTIHYSYEALISNKLKQRPTLAESKRITETDIDFLTAKVIAPLCLGYDDKNSGEALQDLLHKHWIGRKKVKPNNIFLYFGPYDKVGRSYKDRVQERNFLLDQWINNNFDFITDNGIQLLIDEKDSIVDAGIKAKFLCEWSKSEEYKAANERVIKLLLEPSPNKTRFRQKIISDVINYYTKPKVNKLYSPTKSPALSVASTDSEASSQESFGSFPHSPSSPFLTPMLGPRPRTSSNDSEPDGRLLFPAYTTPILSPMTAPLTTTREEKADNFPLLGKPALDRSGNHTRRLNYERVEVDLEEKSQIVEISTQERPDAKSLSTEAMDRVLLQLWHEKKKPSTDQIASYATFLLLLKEEEEKEHQKKRAFSAVAVMSQTEHELLSYYQEMAGQSLETAARQVTVPTQTQSPSPTESVGTPNTKRRPPSVSTSPHSFHNHKLRPRSVQAEESPPIETCDDSFYTDTVPRQAKRSKGPK